MEAKFRRQGIGQALVKMCEDLSTEWGHSVLFLHVEESNTSALDFYARLGFVEIKRDLAWYARHKIWSSHTQSRAHTSTRNFLDPASCMS